MCHSRRVPSSADTVAQSARRGTRRSRGGARILHGVTGLTIHGDRRPACCRRPVNTVTKKGRGAPGYASEGNSRIAQDLSASSAERDA